MQNPRNQRDTWSEVMSGIEIDLNSLGDDPEKLMAAFQHLDSGADLPDQAGQTAQDPTPEKKVDPVAEKPPEQTTQEQKQQAAEPEGVATKDGKHVIPYSVLKSERERANRAEQLAREAQERLTALEKAAGAKNGEGARTEQQEQLPEVADLSPEDLASLKEDFPTVYKALMATQAATKAVEERLSRPVQEIQEERHRTVVESVQDAIDSVPKMAHIQATDKDTFELAKQFDATLRAQPAWAGKPLAERFAKVVEMVEAVNGAITLPTSQKQPSPEELKAAALALAQQSAKKTGTSVPTSLSDFPAGDPPAQSTEDEMEKLTPMQLAEKFSRMTPDQMDAYFQGA